MKRYGERMDVRGGNAEPGASGADRGRLHRLVWAAAWISFFADFSTELIYGVLPAFYLETLALGIVSLGVIEGTAEAVVAVAKLWSGTRSDRTGRRGAWMFAGYTLSGAAKPMIGLVSGGLAVGALRALDRLGKGIRGAPRDALIADTIDAGERGRAFGVIRAMDHAGALVGGLVAAGLLAAGTASPRSLFFLS
ncbi:MAG TPA: MFS transporter, partial [Phycisphaerales bacterium]|nr:MFS transporter [Phycisphaerales bacterium]